MSQSAYWYQIAKAATLKAYNETSGRFHWYGFSAYANGAYFVHPFMNEEDGRRWFVNAENGMWTRHWGIDARTYTELVALFDVHGQHWPHPEAISPYRPEDWTRTDWAR